MSDDVKPVVLWLGADQDNHGNAPRYGDRVSWSWDERVGAGAYLALPRAEMERVLRDASELPIVLAVQVETQNRHSATLATLDAVTRERDEWQEAHHVIVRERDTLRAENARLRGMLGEARGWIGGVHDDGDDAVPSGQRELCARIDAALGEGRTTP